MDGQSWNTMLEEFRSLGGVAENLRPGEGPLARGLFPVEPELPVRLHVPKSLLLAPDFVSFDEEQVGIGAAAPIGSRERAFLESYLREFSWAVRRHDIQALLSLFQEAPTDLRQVLETPFHAQPWLAGPTPAAISERFVAARTLPCNGVRVLAPVADLINHGIGPLFQMAQGIDLEGKFAGEVVTRHGPSDPLGIFLGWGFASPIEMFALSLELTVTTRAAPIVIGRQPLPFGANTNPFIPRASLSGGAIRLPHLLLGHKRVPKMPRSLFYNLMTRLGRASEGEEVFDRILHANRMACHRLAFAAEQAPPPLCCLLRNLARYQLEAMSFNIGGSEAS